MDENVRILVAEDSGAMSKILNEYLSGNGFETCMAMDGQYALERLQAGAKYDLLITDIGMPRMNGVELLTTVKKKYSGLPVIVYSLGTPTPVIEEVHKRGAFFAAKEGGIQSLEQALEEAIGWKPNHKK